MIEERLEAIENRLERIEGLLLQQRAELITVGILANSTDRPDKPNRMMSTRDAAELLGLAAATLNSWRYAGTGPDFVQVSASCVRYWRSDLRAWADALKVEPCEDGAR